MKKKWYSVLLWLLVLSALQTTAAPERPRILGLSHLALYVHDLDAAKSFYQDFLGYGESFLVGSRDGSPPALLIRIRNGQYVELVPEREAGSDRLVKVAVETDDAEAMRLYLSSRGVLVPDKVGKDRLGDAVFAVQDPDGHLVEFVQHKPDGWVMRQLGRNPNTVSTDMRHVGILVGALEPAMKFYRDVLGFKEIWRGSRDEKELNWVNMQVANGQDYFEFMLYRDLPEPSRRGTQHHLCLFVPDIEKAAATLQERAGRAGYTRAMEIRTGTNRKRQLNLYDPDGTRTELMEATTVDGQPAPSSNAPPPRPRN